MAVWQGQRKEREENDDRARDAGMFFSCLYIYLINDFLQVIDYYL